jgi:hypothetical protein
VSTGRSFQLSHLYFSMYSVLITIICILPASHFISKLKLFEGNYSGRDLLLNV